MMWGMSTCFDENGLADYFEASVDPKLAAEVDAHVEGCRRCRALVATYARMFSDAAETGPATTAGPAPLALPSAILARSWAERQVGLTVGRWTLERVIGLGGSGVVFEAIHRTGSRVAIKVLRPEHVEHLPVSGRFMREAYVANRVEHPGVVRVIDDGTTEQGLPFLVMDRLEGETLRERIDRAGTMEAREVIEVARAVLDVLAHTHARGIVHRDLKPENVFLERTGAVRVLDFGIARARERVNDGLTETGFGIGTTAYMPPEQARGDWKDVDARSDLWALAATMVYALAKRHVHVADTPQRMLILAATTAAPSAASLAPRLAPSLARALDRALAFDPAKRPRDARAMKEELEHALSAGPERSGLSVVIAALTIAAVLGGVAFAASRPTRASEPAIASTPSAVESPTTPVSASAPAITRPGATPPPTEPSQPRTESSQPRSEAARSRGEPAARPSFTGHPTPASPASATEAPALSAPVVPLAPSASDDDKMRRRH